MTKAYLKPVGKAILFVFITEKHFLLIFVTASIYTQMRFWFWLQRSSLSKKIVSSAISGRCVSSTAMRLFLRDLIQFFFLSTPILWVILCGSRSHHFVATFEQMLFSVKLQHVLRVLKKPSEFRLSKSSMCIHRFCYSWIVKKESLLQHQLLNVRKLLLTYWLTWLDAWIWATFNERSEKLVHVGAHQLDFRSPSVACRTLLQFLFGYLKRLKLNRRDCFCSLVVHRWSMIFFFKYF